MKLAVAEPVYMIHNLETLQREIAIEGPEQIITIARIFAQYDIPELIKQLRRLEEWERGKKAV